MATVVTLDDIIGNVDKELVEILKKDFREVLDKRTTILDLSYDALKVNVYRNTAAHLEAYDKAYRILISAVSKIAKRKYTSLNDVPPSLLQGNFPYIYIDNGDNDRFIVANSFGAIDNFIRTVSRDSEVSKTSFGTSTIFKSKKDGKGRTLPDEYIKDYRRKVDIGHIPTEDNENLVSPLEEKISAVMQYGRKIGNAAVEAAAERALKELYSIQVDATYSFRNTTPEAIFAAKKALGEGYVVVTLHRQKLNNKFSKEEAKIFFNLKNIIAKVLQKQPFERMEGSNTIVQDIREGLLHILDPKLKKPKLHRVINKTSAKKSISATSKAKNIAVTVPKKQSDVPFIESSIKLETLLNIKLFEAVKKNMGGGGRQDVLNFRSGRFARSVKIERITQSRQGMISIFYSYMKNPYATFSQGGRQELPKSRDPKLLISKSIREIAQGLVSNRMRAVSL